MRISLISGGFAGLFIAHVAAAQPAPAPEPAPSSLAPAPATLPVEAPQPAPATPPHEEGTAAVVPTNPAAPPPAEPGTETQSAVTAPVLFAPASPAFDAIGATPTTIAHPTTVQSMGAALLSYVDANGRVNAGVALEAAPLWLAFGDAITLRSWRGDYGNRALSRLSLSFASSANAAGLTDISQGLRFVIADTTDPRWDKELETCVVAAIQGGLPQRQGGALPVDPGGDPAVVADAGVKNCQAAAKLRADKNLAGTYAVAFSTAATEQQGKDTKATFGKYFAWFSALGNLGKGARWLSVLGSARYVFNHPGHELDVAARIRAGNSSLGISVDGGWTPRTNDQDEFKMKAGIVGLNGELRVSDTLWLMATAGGKFGADSGGAPDLFSVLHLKFSTESAASIGPVKHQ